MKVISYLLSVVLLAIGVTAGATTTKTTTPAKKAAPAVESGRVVLTKDNSITMNDVIDSDTVAKLLMDVKALDSRLPSGDPIYLVLNSPGGSIDAGVELIERLSHLNRKVHTISLFSASMAFQTAQGLGDRLVTQDGTMMSHKARGGFYGEFPGQLDSRYSYYLKRVNRLDSRVVARTKGKHTMKSYAALIENEYWCDGQECVTQGLADKVVTATCDKSLDGQRRDEYKFLFFGQRIVLTLVSDACPLNTGILDVEIAVNGNKLYAAKDPNKYYYSDSDDIKLTPDQLNQLDERVKKIVQQHTERTNVVRY